MIPILLTATVNPKGMVGANFDPEERAQMYCEAVNFYLDKGLSVVIAENSGAADNLKFQVPSSKFQVPSSRFLGQRPKIKGQRSKFNDQALEILDVSGDEYDQSRGKGYNETILIHKAVLKSKFIQEAGSFFKITGRLKVLNIEKLLKEVEKFQDQSSKVKVSSFKFQVPGSISSKIQAPSSNLAFLADCKDHNIYEFLHMPINGHAGECRYWFASVDFFEQNMYPRVDELNDYDTPERKKFLAEDLMLDICRKFRHTAGCRDRFRTQARISGRGGHNLGKGWSFFYSTDNDSFALKTKCAIRQMLRWIVPGVRM